MTQSWAVVATVDEPAVLVQAFVLHHLNQGAAGVHLFLDAPGDEVKDLLAGVAGCHITACDAAHWQGALGRRPHLHTRRQITNANLVYQDCRADWLLHCDADEFVRDGRAMVGELGRFGADDVHLRLSVAERVYGPGLEPLGIFEGLFRLPLRQAPEVVDEIYRPVAGFLDNGLTGHAAGKGLVRTGRGLTVSIHQPEGDIPSKRLRATRLLHFDGLTPFHYLLKLLRRAYEKQYSPKPRHKPGRLTQLTAMRENLEDPGFCDEITRALKWLTPAQAARLLALEVLDDQVFAPDLGGLDLSVVAFDRVLKARYQGFLAENAPGLL